jgi:hypothetical protein
MNHILIQTFGNLRVIYKKARLKQINEKQVMEELEKVHADLGKMLKDGVKAPAPKEEKKEEKKEDEKKNK